MSARFPVALTVFALATCASAQPISERYPLFTAFPSFEARFPRVKLVDGFTPIEAMANLEKKLYFDAGRPAPDQPMLWVKRDDVSTQPLGGNKARKLEFLIADAASRGAKTVITSGMYGSNHALATALAAKDYGLQATLILGPQPVTEDVRKKLLADHALGAKLRYHWNRIGMALDFSTAKIMAMLSKKLYYIPPGGSNALGELGYVNAFFELTEQLTRDELPKRIYVPVGTMGTAAGLLVGMCLTDNWERTQLVGVGVADPLLTNEYATRAEARSLYKFIRRQLNDADRAKLPACDFMHSKKALEYRTEYYAPGYGASSPALVQSNKLVKDIENITLDETYSGKAMRCLLDDLRQRIQSGLPPVKTMFWLTYDSYDLDLIINAHPWADPAHKWRELPKAFWKFFQTP